MTSASTIRQRRVYLPREVGISETVNVATHEVSHFSTPTANPFIYTSLATPSAISGYFSEQEPTFVGTEWITPWGSMSYQFPAATSTSGGSDAKPPMFAKALPFLFLLFWL